MHRLAAASCIAFLTACASTEPPIPDSASPAPVQTAATSPDEPGRIEFAEAPTPAPQDVPVRADAPRIVCQLERRTGTNRKVRVCREQTSAADAAEAREVFDSLRRQQIDLDQP